MTRPVTTLDKPAVLAGLFAVWEDIETLLGDLADGQWQEQSPLPGWNVHDVTAHMVGTESMLSGMSIPEADIDVSTLEHVRNGIGEMNERWVRELRAATAGELLDKFRATTSQRRQQLSDMSHATWNDVTSTPAGPDTYGRFMRVRIFDCWMHEHDIRDALGQPVSTDELVGPATELALDEMATSMGFVVGKRGGAPEGSRVSIELMGPVGRTINVAVEGKARVVDDFGADHPTSTIRLDTLLFTRLAGGRTPVVEHDNQITYGGDEAVGRRIVENLNYVI